MKILKALLVLSLLLAVLCSCGKEDVLGNYGEDYGFDYHYALTPDDIFYVDNLACTVVRVSKSDFTKTMEIAQKSAFGIEDPWDFSAEIVGISSKWLFVNSCGDVYKLSHDGAVVEKTIEAVKSARFHKGNGFIYFTKNDEDGILSIYSFDLKDDKTTLIQKSPSESTHWCQLSDGSIGLIGVTGVAIYPDGRVEEKRISYLDRDVDTGRDSALAVSIRGFMEEYHELKSYAEVYGCIYYLDVHPLTKVTSLIRINKDGTDNTVLDENTELQSLFAYNNTLYGDVNEADSARLVTVDKNGVITKIDPVTIGAGQWGHIEIDDELFIRTYDSIRVPFLRYIYNPATGEIITP